MASPPSSSETTIRTQFDRLFIEVRNTSFPTLTRRVEVRAGEPVRLRHRFR